MFYFQSDLMFFQANESETVQAFHTSRYLWGCGGWGRGVEHSLLCVPLMFECFPEMYCFLQGGKNNEDIMCKGTQLN